MVARGWGVARHALAPFTHHAMGRGRWGLLQGRAPSYEEVESLIASGVPATAKAFQAHGYRRVVEYLQGKRTREDALNQMKLDTRHYAKRQLSWWRSWPGVKWIERFGYEAEAFEEAQRALRENR